jgi:TolA-binding protein
VSEVKSFLASKGILPRLGSAVARADHEESSKPDGESATPSEKREANAASKLRMAKELEDAGKIEKAKVWYEDIINKFPKTRAAADARVFLDKLNK